MIFKKLNLTGLRKFDDAFTNAEPEGFKYL